MIERVGIEDAPVVQRLFERCSEFLVLCEGAPAAPDTAEKELTFVAPGKTLDDTFNFGVYDGGELIALVELYREFPKPSEWFLGLLMLDPAHRGRGLGAEIHREVLDFLAARGATTLWIAVMAQNEAALRFWIRQGYVERERQKRVGAAGLESEAILMNLPVRTC
jgi:ribosomal protein S18 acetylase RimI-like enzyme